MRNFSVTRRVWMDLSTALNRGDLCFSGFLGLAKACALKVLFRFNLLGTIRELKRLAKKHGPYFLAYAICIELFEDVALPALLYSAGKPHLIPVALAFHCEPIAYPLYFALAAAVRRLW